MTTALTTYLACWVALTLLAAAVAVRFRATLSLFHPAYRQFLVTPWKLAMFAVALVGIVAIAPSSGDPTWDGFDAALMAGLTFTTAPWAIGVLYRAIAHRPRPLAPVSLAVVLWLFSASWCYDGYLVIRDGSYPVTWAWNLLVSSCLYLLAGLFWNLDWAPGVGTYFSFQRDPWPTRSLAPFRRTAAWSLPIAVAVALLFASFALDLIR